MNTIELEVHGMTCGSCVKHVTKALQSVPGVSRVEVDLANGRARVAGDLPTGAEPLIAALAVEDYPAHLASNAGTSQAPKTGSCQSGQGEKDGKASKGGCCCE